VVIGDGHIDMGPRFVNGAWTIQIRDDTVEPVAWRDPDDVVLHAVGAAELPIPDDPRFAFLGEPGAPVWLLPQVQKPGILWPGWNTQDPQVATTIRREVTWSLRGVVGPGTFVLFLNENFGKPEVVFDSRKPYPQRTGIDANTHVHGNWVFGKEGTYLLDIEMSAVGNDGRQLTDRATVRVYVGEGNAASAFDATATPTPTPTPSRMHAPSAAPPTRAAVSPFLWVGAAGVVVVVAAAIAGFALRRRRSR
jgi:putative ABC transporter-associated repeat protein